jgi:predicted DNA-binding transcriptional regulator AlpA
MPQKYTIDSRELAVSLGIPRHAILSHRARQAQHPLLIGLPEPVMLRPRLVWLRADIEAWLDSRRTFKPAPATAEQATPTAPEPPARRGRGRPRKNTAPAGQEGGAK